MTYDTKKWIENTNGERKNIVIDAKLPCDPFAMIAGIGSIIFGTSLLVFSAFVHGADKQYEAEFKTMDSLGLFNNEKGDDTNEEE